MRTKEELQKVIKSLVNNLSKNNLNETYNISGEVYANMVKNHLKTANDNLELLQEVKLLKQQLAVKPRIVYRVR